MTEKDISITVSYISFFVYIQRFSIQDDRAMHKWTRKRGLENDMCTEFKVINILTYYKT